MPVSDEQLAEILAQAVAEAGLSGSVIRQTVRETLAGDLAAEAFALQFHADRLHGDEVPPRPRKPKITRGSTLRPTKRRTR
jgi:hypothetical protein